MVPVVYRLASLAYCVKHVSTIRVTYLQFVNFALNVALVWNWVSALRSLDCLQHLAILATICLVIYLLIDVLIKLTYEF